MKEQARTYLDQALLLLQDGLLAFHKGWWASQLGEPLSKQSKDIATLLNILTAYWEGEQGFGTALAPQITALNLGDAKTFRSRIEQLKAYCNQYSHQEDVSLEDTLFMVRECKLVFEVFSRYGTSLEPYQDQLNILYEMIEKQWVLVKYGVAQPAIPAAEVQKADPNLEKPAAPAAISETQTPKEEGAPKEASPPETPEKAASDAAQARPTAATEPPNPATAADPWWAKFFGKHKDAAPSSPPPPRMRSMLDLRNDIIDEVTETLLPFKFVEKPPFTQLQVFVWASQATQAYESFFITHANQNLRLENHLIALGLGHLKDFSIPIHVFSDAPPQLVGASRDLFFAKGFYITTEALSDAVQQQKETAPKQALSARLTVILGKLEGSRKKFTINPENGAELTIGRNKTVYKNGFLLRTNTLAFENTDNQKIISKQHATVRYNAENNTYVLLSEAVNQTAIYRKGLPAPLFATGLGQILVHGDLIQLAHAEVAQILFELIPFNDTTL